MSTLLPFVAHQDRFLDMLRQGQIVILESETGTGKSTMAPLAMLEAGIAGDKMIAVTEPRRFVTTQLAKRVSYLHGSPLGEVVGYQIGNDRRVSEICRIKYMVEQILLNEMHTDPLLSRYGVIMIDEVHERLVTQDILLALVLDILPKRPDLKLVLASATLKKDVFSEYCGNAPVCSIPGRMFPVEVRYAEHDIFDLNRACAEKIVEIVKGEECGDVLAFLPDPASINKVQRRLEQDLESVHKKVRILPLYGSLDQEDQDAVYEQGDFVRIVLATNIAETSLTIDGVKHIVDTGLIKGTVYVDASTSALQILDHSKAGCDQRKGRVGRTMPGICHRLYTQKDFESRDQFTLPEIQRKPLDQVLLQLRCMQFATSEVFALKLMSPPTSEQWEDARKRLLVLGALDDQDNVTWDGEVMNRFPAEPMIGRMMLEAKKRGCVNEMIVIAAALSVSKSVFVSFKDKEKQALADEAQAQFMDLKSDPLSLLNAWKAWNTSDRSAAWARKNYLSSIALSEIDRLREQFITVLQQEGIEPSQLASEVELRKAIAASMIVNLAVFTGSYKYQCNGKTTWVFPGSALMGELPPQYLVCMKVVETSKAYMRQVHVVEKAWLEELVPRASCKKVLTVEQNNSSRAWQVVSEYAWNGIVVERTVLEEIPEELSVQIAAQAVETLVNAYSNIWERGRELVALWNRMRPNTFGCYGEERQRMLKSVRDRFEAVVMKKLVGLPTIGLMLNALDSITTEDILTSEELAAYNTKHALDLEYERQEAARLKAERDRREQILSQLSEQMAPLKAEVEALDVRMTALKARGVHVRDSYLSGIAMDAIVSPIFYGDPIERARSAVSEYARMIGRAEREADQKFGPVVKIYKSVLAQLPVCPVCGSEWNDSYMCNEMHDTNRLIDLSGNDPRFLGEFMTDRDEPVAEVLVRRSGSVWIKFAVEKNEAWNGRVFKNIVFTQNLMILPESLASERELIEMWIAELNEAKQKLQAELDWLDELKKGVASGEVAALDFFDRGDGFMVAVYKNQSVLAPYHDLTFYPKPGERWWCQITSSGNTVQISHIRKVGTPDIDKILADGSQMFPGLPTELLQ